MVSNQNSVAQNCAELRGVYRARNCAIMVQPNSSLWNTLVRYLSRGDYIFFFPRGGGSVAVQDSPFPRVTGCDSAI